MTDTDLLKEKMRASGYRFKFIAEKIGLTYPGFLKKIKNETEFTASEIVKLSKLLSLNNEERDKIFFAA